MARHAFEQGRENEKLAHEAQGIIHQMGSGENASSVLQAKLEQLVEQKKRQALAMFSVAEGAARTPEMRAAAAAALSRIQVWMVQSNATAAVSNSSSSLSPESRQPTLEVAVESARRAARALPFAHEAHAALGNALYHAEDRPGAMLAYEEAVSLMPLTGERRAEVSRCRF